MESLQRFLAESNKRVDMVLDELLPRMDVEPGRLHEAIRWSMFAGGKRVRPCIVYAAGETFGANRDLLDRSAAAIEMIHTFSLIHDDLPAMDDDDLRRGRETCHKKFDEATAILAGDALQVKAFQTIAEDEGLSYELRVRLVGDIAAASGTPVGMVAGQQLDLEAEGSILTVAELENIHARKTGALITVSARAGAIIGGAVENEIEVVDLYAARLGLLFQITDDLLDVTQETATLGKTAGKDASAAKATFPGHFGIEGSREMAAKVCGEACSALDGLDLDTSLLKGIAEMVLDRSR